MKYRDGGDFKSAALILAETKEKEKPAPAKKRIPTDPLVGTTWDFLGTKQQRINGLKFKRDGTVVAESLYPNASWKRLNDNTILFNYAPNDSFIVFHVQPDLNLMKGYHSAAGLVRYIRKVK